MKAWHFIRANKKLGYGDDRDVKVGETLTMIITRDARLASGRENFDPEVPTLCKSGMHGSVKITNALSYAPGLTLCEVEIEGDVVEGNDKIVGRTRRVVRMIDATQIIVRFALICSDRAKEHAEYAAKYAKYAAKYTAKYAAKSAEYAKYTAEYAAKYAELDAEHTAKYAACAAESAACAAEYTAESEREEQEKILLSLIEEAFAAQGQS